MRRTALLLAAIPLAALLAPATAMARDEAALADAPAGKAAEIAQRLNDPLTQYVVAGMVTAASKALLEMPVAPVVAAVEQASGRRRGNLPRDARLADLAGVDQDRLRERIVADVLRAMAAMGALASAAGRMPLELERMARTLRQSVPQP
ncbi:MAG: hypothetical protein FJX31_01970 [Alphaproteobacteria bacterium]|nr:hypothetical protein [Alphaproteobacteria bacterium]